MLEEFDEGKRSCRRRLAGHNRRRRKTHPENMVNSGPLTDEHSSSYLLNSLLRILTNMHGEFHIICMIGLFMFGSKKLIAYVHVKQYGCHAPVPITRIK